MKKFLKNPKNLNRLIIVISMFTVFGSLFLSEVIGIEACKYCWGIRLGLFPILPISIYFETKNLETHANLYHIFSGLGLVVSSVYWFKTQFSPMSLKCGLDIGTGCLENAVKIIGFVNMPFIGMIVSILIIILTILIKRNTK